MLDLGNLALALTLAHQALEFRWAQNDRWGLAYSFENFASLALTQGDIRRATQLWGVAERLHQETNAPMPTHWKNRHEGLVALTKHQLDEVSFSAGWQEGRRMELEEAVKYALAMTPSVLT